MSAKLTTAKFWARALRQDDGCWIWSGSIDTRGYGSVGINGRMWRAHRLAYALAVGPLPDRIGHHGACVCHTCDNRACINPEHLFLGSHADNMADAAAKQRFTNKGVRNGRAKLTPAQVLEIRRTGKASRKYASRFGVSSSVIARIKKRELWAHLPEEHIA